MCHYSLKTSHLFIRSLLLYFYEYSRHFKIVDEYFPDDVFACLHTGFFLVGVGGGGGEGVG